MDAQVGDLGAPALEPAVEFLPRGEAPTRQRIALDVLHPALDLALGARPVRLAGPRGEAVVTGKVLEQRMPQYLVLAAPQHQRARIVVQAAERHAATVSKRALVAGEQSGQPFVAIPPGQQTPRIAQREHEQGYRLRLLSDPDPELAGIGFRLAAP